MWETQVRSLEKEWLPIPVFLLGEFHGQRSLLSYSPWGRKELDIAKQPTLLLFSSRVGRLPGIGPRISQPTIISNRLTQLRPKQLSSNQILSIKHPVSLSTSSNKILLLPSPTIKVKDHVTKHASVRHMPKPLGSMEQRG